MKYSHKCFMTARNLGQWKCSASDYELWAWISYNTPLWDSAIGRLEFSMTHGHWCDGNTETTSCVIPPKKRYIRDTPWKKAVTWLQITSYTSASAPAVRLSRGWESSEDLKVKLFTQKSVSYTKWGCNGFRTYSTSTMWNMPWPRSWIK